MKKLWICPLIIATLILSAFSIMSIAASAVGTSTTQSATSYSFQRQMFYDANGLFWVFYTDGEDHIVHQTSSNGQTWSEPTTIISGTGASAGPNFALAFNGSHMAFAIFTGAQKYFQMGTPLANGTISWVADAQVVPTVSPQAYLPSITFDSDGYIWIGYRYANISATPKTEQPYVVKNSKRDGTWANAEDFPHQLAITNSPTSFAVPVPLTAGKMYMVFIAELGGQLQGKSWNGSSWGSRHTISNEQFTPYELSALAISDSVHIVFLESPKILYVKKQWGQNPESSITLAEVGFSPTITKSGQKLFVFWYSYNNFYVKAFIDGWKTTMQWFSDENVVSGSLNSLYEKQEGKCSILYTRGSSSPTSGPYSVKFDQFTYSSIRGPFTITNANNDLPILNANWDDLKRILNFKSQGDITVDVGDWGMPLRIEADNEVFTDWIYSSTLKRVTVNNVASLVEVMWALPPEQGGGGGGGGGEWIVPTPVPTPTPIVVPPLAQYGTIALAGIIGVAVVVSQIRRQKTVKQLFSERRGKRRNLRESWKRKKHG